MPSQKNKRFYILSNILFWFNHGLYFVLLGIMGTMGAMQFAFNIPWNVTIMLYLLMLVPILVAGFVFFKKIYRDPPQLMKIFFGIELPIMVMAFFRLILIREMTPVLWFFLSGALFSLIGLFIVLFYREVKSKWANSLLFLSQETALILGAYIFLLFFFFLPIVLASIVQNLGAGLESWVNLFISSNGLAFFAFLFWLLFLGLTAGLLIVTPFAAIFIFWKSFRALHEKNKQQLGPRSSVILGLGFGILFIGASIGLGMQIHSDTYSMQLAKIKSAESFEAQQPHIAELFRQEKDLKTKLRDDYLAPYRYLDDSQARMIESGYERILSFDEINAKIIQKAFNIVASPFIYGGNFYEDGKRASTDYEEIFDAHIQDGEKEKIVKALEATNTRDTLKASFLDKNKQVVHMETQKIEATTFDLDRIAKVSVEETYKNTASSVEEVYYEFSLPTDSVLTDLKLGPNLEHQATISPKGAARKTYENQVRLTQDPALLEQIGPRQYRLRVFPIPARLDPFRTNTNRIANPMPEMAEVIQKVKFEYITFRTQDGIALPDITELRNAYSDDNTVRKYRLNGKEVLNAKNAPLTAIALPKMACPPSILKMQSPALTTSDNFFQESELYFVPYKTNNGCGETQPLPKNDIKGTRIALLLDTSYSNHQTDWTAYLQKNLPLEKLIAQNTVDLYYFNDKISKKIPLTRAKLEEGLAVHFYGKTDRLKAIESFFNQFPVEDYDGIFMLTDGSDFDQPAPQEEDEVSNFTSIVSMIHIDKNIPNYEDIFTTRIIRGRGDVFTDPALALDHFWYTKMAAEENIIMLDNNEYGFWMLQRKDSKPVNTISFSNAASAKIVDVTSPEFKTLGASNLIKFYMRRYNSEDALLSLHAFAKEQSIISPYSSMVALVNDRQKDELNRAEADQNPFKAKVGEDQQYLPQPSGAGGILSIGSTPEPHEWALIILGITMLSYFYRKDLFTFFLGLKSQFLGH